MVDEGEPLPKDNLPTKVINALVESVDDSCRDPTPFGIMTACTQDDRHVLLPIFFLTLAVVAFAAKRVV